MPTYESSALTSARPESAWEVWTDVAGWRKSAAIKSAEIDGEFQTGAVIRSKAKGFPRSTLTVTEVDRPRLWVDQSRQPGVQMTFHHLIEPTEGGTSLTERVVIDGPLARLIGPLIRRKLEALFDDSVKYLAGAAETVEAEAQAAGDERRSGSA
jgi:hypothetical protein